MNPPLSFKYRAFLSYSHRDVGWAKWLHARLEAFRLDKDLIGRETPRGPVPKMLRPIFRDREDFSGGHTLNEATVAALDASAALIVLCSTVAASRPAVNEEVRLFRSRHPDRPVMPVIVDGSWPGNFPPALRFELDADGGVTDRPITILGPDLRDSADGKTLGLAKTIAGLTGLGADDIFRRAERARRRRTQIWGAVAGCCLLLAVLASASAAYAWHELKTNEAFLNATLKRTTDIVNESVAQAEKYGVPRTATLALLAHAEGLFDDMARYGRPTLELRYRKAWMLIQFARNYEVLGDTDKQGRRATEAYQLLVGLAAEKPDNPYYQLDLAVADEEVGDVLVARGKLDEALKLYRDSLAISERLAATDRGNRARQHALSSSYARIGSVLVAQGKLDEALKVYRLDLDISARLAAADRHNSRWQHDLAAAYLHVGDILAAQNKLDAALKADRSGVDLLQGLAKDDPGNARWQRDLSVSYDKIGALFAARGNLGAALKAYRDHIAIAERLAASDPSNSGWQGDLSWSYIQVGDVLVAQGNLDEALKVFRDSLGIREHLAAADRSNLDRQRDLAVSYQRIGDVLATQGEVENALMAYRDSLAIVERTAAADRSNKAWQRDPAVLYQEIGNLLLAQGKFDDALKSYRDCLAITGRLAAADRSNANAQRDLAVSYEKVGEVLLAQDKVDDALKAYRDSLAIMEPLAAADRSNSTWQRFISVSYSRVGDMLMAQGKFDEALKVFDDSFVIVERLAASDRSNVSGSTVSQPATRTTQTSTSGLAKSPKPWLRRSSARR